VAFGCDKAPGEETRTRGSGGFCPGSHPEKVQPPAAWTDRNARDRGDPHIGEAVTNQRCLIDLRPCLLAFFLSSAICAKQAERADIMEALAIIAGIAADTGFSGSASPVQTRASRS
jgi:hypothetical protein